MYLSPKFSNHMSLVTKVTDFFFLESLLSVPSSLDGKKEKICLQCRTPGFNPWVGKIPLEKRMATHSSILAWRNPWTEEPGGIQSMGSQRVGTRLNE